MVHFFCRRCPVKPSCVFAGFFVAICVVPLAHHATEVNSVIAFQALAMHVHKVIEACYHLCVSCYLWICAGVHYFLASACASLCMQFVILRIYRPIIVKSARATMKINAAMSKNSCSIYFTVLSFSRPKCPKFATRRPNIAIFFDLYKNKSISPPI